MFVCAFVFSGTKCAQFLFVCTFSQAQAQNLRKLQYMGADELDYMCLNFDEFGAYACSVLIGRMGEY